MRPLIAILAFFAVVCVSAQGVTDKISPPGGFPQGSVQSIESSFHVSVIDIGHAKRDADNSALEKHFACDPTGQLLLTLNDSVLKDARNRTGYISASRQFQFDNPPQHGAVLTAGFSVCANGSLALGPSAVFYQCASGGFSNIYDQASEHQCGPIHIQVRPCFTASSGGVSGQGAGETGQGRNASVVGTQVMHTTVVTVLEDGQPQVVATEMPVPICQISDGQIQAHTTPCADIPVTIPTAHTTCVETSTAHATPTGQGPVNTGTPSDVPGVGAVFGVSSSFAVLSICAVAAALLL